MFEQSHFLYYLFFVLGFVAVLTFGLIYYRKFKFTFVQALLIVLTVYPIAVAVMFTQYWIESGFKDWGGNNIVRVFIWIPVIALPFTKLLKVDWKKALEFLAPLPCVVHGIAHYGCIFEGCCCGYPVEFGGIWNPVSKNYLFPVQPIEATVAVMIVVITVWIVRRYGYSGKSNAYPLMLIMFGSTRFALEFLRDNQKLFWGISNLAIHAFVMFVVGVVWYFVPWEKIFKKKKSDSEAVESN